ncbi:MAG: 8-oxo-dGTP diphosphatase MutT [Enterovibrio sp.]
MKKIHVAAGVILSKDAQQVLLAKRPLGKEGAGLWEFAGGKVEADEKAHDALVRELYEELGITACDSEHFLSFAWQEPHLWIEFDFFWVRDFSGTPHGKEGQAIEWVDVARLREFCFPKANEIVLERVMQELQGTLAPLK